MKRWRVAILLGFMATIAAQPTFALNILMLTDNSGSLTAVESTLKGRLEAAGWTVHTLWDGDTQANYDAAIANNDVVYITSDIAPTDVGTKLRTCPIGVINEPVAFMDDVGLCTAAGTTTSVSSLSISNNTHYITNSFSTGFFSMGSISYPTAQRGGTTATGAGLATANLINSLIAVDIGGTLANTINSNSTASGRRVQMPVPLGVVDTSTFTSNFNTLLWKLVLWAASFDGSLEAQWKLNETFGSFASDSSGNGRTGTVTGTSSWVPGMVNNGFSFNGATKIQATGLMGNPRNVSIAAWAKLTTADTNGAEIISLGDHFALRLDEAGNTKAIYYNGTDYTEVDLPVTFAGTGWHHFAASFDDPHKSLKLYVDGELAASTITTTSISYTGLGTNTVIGRHGNADTNHDFTGIIDDVRVYSYVIDPTEVAQLFGLIGRWKLNETAGTTAADATVFKRDATLTGAAAWSTDCGGMRVFDFNGSTQNFTLNNTADFQPTTMLSISAWVKGNVWKDSSGGDVDTVLRKGDSTPNNYALSIASGKVMLLLEDSDTVGIRGNTVLNPGQWYHVAATWDGTTAKIYVNGVLDNGSGTAKSGSIGTDTRSLYIGGRPGTDYFDGQMRDVQLYNRALTTTEIARLAGLVGWWKFSEGAGSAAADSSGAAASATLSGGASWTSDCAGNNNALLTNGLGAIAQTNAPFTPPDVGTVSFFIRSTGNPAARSRILGLGNNFEVRQETDGTLAFDLNADAGTDFLTTSALNKVGQWYHVAATFDSANNSYAVYVDGQLQKSGTNANSMSQQLAAVLSFGVRTGTTEYWNGALRDVRVYSRKLCPSEIADLAGLIGYWKLDETLGSTAADSSGISRNGTVIGTPTWTPGKLNNCIQLNGTNRVEINSLLGAPKNVTMAAFANLTAPDTGGAELVSIGDYFSIRLDNAGVSRAFFYNGTTWVNCSVSQSYAGTGWHHYAAVFSDDQNYCKFYVDGNEVASVSTTVTIPYTGQGTKTVIGSHGNGQTAYDFVGKIDDVRIYSRALCPTEIQTLSSSGFGGVKITKWFEIQ